MLDEAVSMHPVEWIVIGAIWAILGWFVRHVWATHLEALKVLEARLKSTDDPNDGRIVKLEATLRERMHKLADDINGHRASLVRLEEYRIAVQASLADQRDEVRGIRDDIRELREMLHRALGNAPESATVPRRHI